MVYPKNWILEDECSTGKTSGVFGLNMVFLHLMSRQRRFWIWELRHCAWIDRDEFWMMPHHLFCGFGRQFVCLWLFFVSLRLSFDHECDLEPWTFFYGSCPYMVVMWLDEMSCRKGVWKFDALWEHPLCKGEATCHSSSWHSFMHRRYVEGYYKSSSLTHNANGREHSTCCGRNLCIWPRGWSQYSISLRTHHSVTSWDVIDQCWPECGVLISSTSYSGFCLSLVQLIAWAEDTCIGSTLRLFIVSSTLRSLFSPSDENIQLKLLEKSLS